jgi:hypothetical protein
MVVICNFCNKEYASYSSRSNHIKKYHIVNVNHVSTTVNLASTDVNQMSTNIEIIKDKDKYKCTKCDKIFNTRQAHWKHNKKCIISKEIKLEHEVDSLKEQLKEKDKDFNNFKKQIMDLINKQCKIHPKTLTKINKQLNNTTNNTLNDNKVINNNVIIQFGREKLYEVVSKKEQIDVLNHGYLCLENLIERAHFNHKI